MYLISKICKLLKKSQTVNKYNNQACFAYRWPKELILLDSWVGGGFVRVGNPLIPTIEGI